MFSLFILDGVVHEGGTLSGDVHSYGLPDVDGKANARRQVKSIAKRMPLDMHGHYVVAINRDGAAEYYCRINKPFKRRSDGDTSEPKTSP